MGGSLFVRVGRRYDEICGIELCLVRAAAVWRVREGKGQVMKSATDAAPKIAQNSQPTTDEIFGTISAVVNHSRTKRV